MSSMSRPSLMCSTFVQVLGAGSREGAGATGAPGKSAPPAAGLPKPQRGLDWDHTQGVDGTRGASPVGA